MSAIILVIAAALIALVSGRKPTTGDDPDSTQPSETPEVSGNQVAPAGTLAAVGAPKVTVTVDGKEQTGKNIVLPANADFIKVSTAWAISNSTPLPHSAGMKLRLIHERSLRSDDDWAEWIPYVDANGLSGLVEDDLMKDTGTPIRVRHGAKGKLGTAPKMVTVPAASTITFVVELTLPGPGRSTKLAEFWKGHSGANFKLEPELVTDLQPDQGPSGVERLLLGALFLPLAFGGGTSVAGSAENKPVYSLEKATLSSFMTIAFNADAKSTAKVNIQEPVATTSIIGSKISYKATVGLSGGSGQRAVVPVVDWQYRVRLEGKEEISEWIDLPNASDYIVKL